MDMQYVVFLSPIGMWYCFRKLSDESLFLGIYGILATYFSGVMIRLLLVLSPAACTLAGVGVSYVITSYTKALRCETGKDERRKAHSLLGSVLVL
jgi:dolichyl-diphosphooligosaccharide--protein glycosyltransferase